MKHYYYSDNNHQIGPLTLEELKIKQIKKTTLVWTDGLTEWIEAKNIEELADIIIATPPPLPPININTISNQISTLENTINEQYKPMRRYDPSYSNESDATALGLVLLIIPFIFIITGRNRFDNQESYAIFKIISFVYSLLIRIIAVIWVTTIARRQNRNTTSWGIFAFLLPSISLIIIGQTKKFYQPKEW